MNSHVRHCRLAQEGKTWVDVAAQSTKTKFEKLSNIRTMPRPKCVICGKSVRELRGKFCSLKCSYVGRKGRRGVKRSAETKNKIGNALRKMLPRECCICGKSFLPKARTAICCSRKCGSVRSGMTQAGRKQHWKSGGYRERSGRSKSGWYKGFYCGSTYELIFLVYCLERALPVARSVSARQYVFDGKTFAYYPDFDVLGAVYEIKGFHTPQSRAKAAQHPDIILVDKAAIVRMKACTELGGKSLTALVKMYDNIRVAA